MPFAPVTASLRYLLRGLTGEHGGRIGRQWPRAFIDFVPFEFLGDRARHVDGGER